MHTTSVSLLERLQDLEDQCAWERFVQLYSPLLYHWSITAGVNRPDTDDLVQEVLSLLIKELPRFRYNTDQSFRGWLRMVLTNKWRELQRREQRIPMPTEQIADLAEPDWASALAEAEYRRQLVERALRLMQEDFDHSTWKACWEYVAMDRPAEEVAKELGISVNAVYLAKSRVLRRLRGELEGLWQ